MFFPLLVAYFKCEGVSGSDLKEVPGFVFLYVGPLLSLLTTLSFIGTCARSRSFSSFHRSNNSNTDGNEEIKG